MAFGVLTTNSAEEALERACPPARATRAGRRPWPPSRWRRCSRGSTGRPGKDQRVSAGSPAWEFARQGARRGAADAVSMGGRPADRPEVAQTFWRIGEIDETAAERTGADARPRAGFAARSTTSAAIDRVLEDASRNWRLDRMPVIDRLILRMGIYELLYEPATPPAVVIDEATRAGAAVQHRRGGAVHQRRAGRSEGAVERGEIAAEPRAIMTLLDEQIQQRRQPLEALQALGVDDVSAAIRPHRHDRRAGRQASAIARPRRSRPTRSRRSPPAASWRSGTSARRASSALSDGLQRIQIYIRQDALPELDFKIFKLLDFGDHIGVEGHLFRTRTGELTHLGAARRVPGQVPPAAAREVARPAGRRDPLSPALPRSDREPGQPPRVRSAREGRDGDPARSSTPRLRGSRDAGDAADRRRRGGAAVCDAPQRARHGPLPAHRAGAVPQAPGRRRHGAGLRAGAQLPERRACRRSTTPSSRCSSSIRPTPTTTS